MEGIKAAIETKKVEWKKHFEENDMISVSQIYAKDCKFMPQGQDTLYGRDALPKGLSELRNRGSTSVEWKSLEIGPMEVNGDVIFERGEYKFLKSDGSSLIEGKHVVIWKKTSDGYEMYIDIFNENK